MSKISFFAHEIILHGEHREYIGNSEAMTFYVYAVIDLFVQ